ncbi:MAG: hypothetical protein Q9160_004746 [Pyrenula sp. 1 TL-2023]
MVIRKRGLLWDWTNSSGPGNPGVPWAMDAVNFKGPMESVSNWNTWVPPELKGRAPYRPMVHLEPQLQGQEWQNVINSKGDIVHFFNEPERNGISPEKAQQDWANQMLSLRRQHGKKLVSPSCSNDQNGQNWINKWLSLVQEKPDFLGLHYYGTKSGDAIAFIQHMHQQHPNLKIIVSEIASISRNKHEVYQFTFEVANWMDKTDYIFEYSFFGAMRKMPDNFVSPQAVLMKPDGHFTQLMRYLMNDQPMHFHKAKKDGKDIVDSDTEE